MRYKTMFKKELCSSILSFVRRAPSTLIQDATRTRKHPPSPKEDTLITVQVENSGLSYPGRVGIGADVLLADVISIT